MTGDLRPTSRWVFSTGQLTWGGAEKQLVLLVTELARRGRDVVVACLSGETEPYGPVLRERGIPVASFPRRSALDFGRGWRMRRWLAAQAPSAICAFGEFAVGHTSVALVGRRHRPRVVAMLRRSALRLSGLRRRIVERAYRRADLVCANSAAGRDYGIRDLGIPPDRITLLGNVLDPGMRNGARARLEVRRDLGIAEDAPLVVYVGRNAYPKDMGTLCRTLGRVVEGSPQARAVVLGQWLEGVPNEGPDPGPAVRWLGVRRDAVDVIAAADVLLLTSRSEGTPNVVLEAMSLGTPVVATAVGDVPRLLADGAGMIAPSGDDEALAAHVRRLLADPALRRQVAGTAGRRVADEFGLDRVVDRLETLLEGRDGRA
jgi:glycosyltransferase involved in cell wall biosynthesis